MKTNKFIVLKHLLIENKKFIGLKFNSDKVLNSLIKELDGIIWSPEFNLYCLPNSKINLDAIFNLFRGVAWINTNYFFQRSNSKKLDEDFDVKWFRKRQKPTGYKCCPESYLEKLVRSGIKPDAIVIDYLNLIAPNNTGLNSYESVKEITEDIRALSYTFSCPIISATQANRSAFSTPNPDMDMTSESMGLSHTVDAQISIWTEKEDFELGIIHMGIVKNRFGPRQCHTVLEIDYETLSLKDPDQVASSFIVNPSKRRDMENNDPVNSSLINTFDLIESLSLNDEN